VRARDPPGRVPRLYGRQDARPLQLCRQLRAVPLSPASARSIQMLVMQDRPARFADETVL